jgi:hypothetical protein
MLTLSPRVLAAFAFERGEEFDPALTLVSAPLADDLALLASARALVALRTARRDVLVLCMAFLLFNAVCLHPSRHPGRSV